MPASNPPLPVSEPALVTPEVLPVSDAAGVDLTLVRSYLRLTPSERLRALQNTVRALRKFKPMSE